MTTHRDIRAHGSGSLMAMNSNRTRSVPTGVGAVIATPGVNTSMAVQIGLRPHASTPSPTCVFASPLSNTEE